MAEGKISLSDTREKLLCSTCDGNTSGPRFREGFCEVTSLLRPGWGVGIGQAKSRVKGAPGIRPSMDKGLEVIMGLLCSQDWKGSEGLGGGEQGGGRPRMNWKDRQGARSCRAS